MASGYAQLAIESFPGNETNAPVLSTKRLYPPLLSLGHDPGATPMDRNDELRNLNEPFAVLPERYMPKWNIETRGYPDTLGFLFTLGMGFPVTTVGNGVITDPDGVVIPAGAFRHVWLAPHGPAGLRPLTAQIPVAYKDQNFFTLFKGAALESLSIDTPDAGGMRAKAAGPALYQPPTSTVDPALSAVYEGLGIRPFTKSDLTFPAFLAGSAIYEDFNLSYAQSVEADWTGQTATRWNDDMLKGDAPPIWTGSVPKKLIANADYTAMMNAAGFPAVARWTSGTPIAGGYPYKLWFAMANCQLVSGSAAPLANKQRLGATWQFRATNSSGAAGSTTITLVNATPSYL